MNTTIEGPRIERDQSQTEIYEFLSNPANFENVMPDDVVKFESGADWFLFGLKGLPEVKLVFTERIPPSKIVLGSASSKLEFGLVCNIEEAPGNRSALALKFEGQFNPMLKMMVERPLKNFLLALSDKIANF
jgi:hypothetical protein